MPADRSISSPRIGRCARVQPVDPEPFYDNVPAWEPVADDDDDDADAPSPPKPVTT
jgi:hypothetical protein